MKHQNAPRRGREIENPEDAILAPYAEFRYPAATDGIGREFGIEIFSPICSRKRPLPNRNRASFGNLRIASRAFGCRIIDRTVSLYQM
jgi:hypothetical protein